MQQSTWFTPEGLEDLLPPQAQKLEAYRRQLIDGFDAAGFDLFYLLSQNIQTPF